MDENLPSGKSHAFSLVGNIAAHATLLAALVALCGTVVVGYLQFQSAKETAALTSQSAKDAAALASQSAKDTALLAAQTADRASDIHMSEIAVSILRAPPTDEVATLRIWAMDIIDHANARKFTAAERQSLLKKPIAAPTSVANPCPSEGRNQNIVGTDQYSVLIFYRTARISDCRNLIRGLEAGGFPTTSIGTTFDEVSQCDQFGVPNGGIFILPNPEKGVKIANAIQAVVKQNLPNVNVVKVGDAATFSRGDVQVNLY
jgi:hypothetical protein